MTQRHPRFFGDPAQLRVVVALTGIAGVWEPMSRGYLRYKCADGAILNWWPSTGTVNFQGPDGPERRLQAALVSVVARAESPGRPAIGPAVPVSSRDCEPSEDEW